MRYVVSIDQKGNPSIGRLYCGLINFQVSSFEMIAEVIAIYELLHFLADCIVERPALTHPDTCCQQHRQGQIISGEFS